MLVIARRADGRAAFTMEQLGDDVRRAFVLADVIDGDNVGMIESGGGLGFNLEPAQAIGIAWPLGREAL
jgi:hypothetical protein